MRELKIGVSGLGVLHTDESVPDVETKFEMIRKSEVFDYMDRTPPKADLDKHLEASAKYGVPIYAGGVFYLVGRDEGLLEQNLRIGKACGSALHNVQIFTKDADGRMLTDDDVADIYSRTYDLAAKIGIRPCFENHINMWSEHPGRVQRVAEKGLGERHGVQHDDGPFARRHEDGQSKGTGGPGSAARCGRPPDCSRSATAWKRSQNLD